MYRNMGTHFLSEYFRDMFISNRYFRQYVIEWSWPPCLLNLNPWDYILWVFLKDIFYTNNPYIVEELKAEFIVAVVRNFS